MANIPPRLLWNGRPIIQEFPPEEPLYRRFTADQQVNGKFPGVSFIFPDCSMNRGGECIAVAPNGRTIKSLFSWPKDILISDPGFGVLSIKAGDIPPTVTAESGQSGVLGDEYAFCLSHCPEDENYSHSQIQVYVGMIYFNDKPKKSAMKIFRLLACRNVKILIHPSPA